MHKDFKAISLSYKNAPIDIRELLAFDETACKRLLRFFKEFTDISEAMVLSTCNRTEVYYTSKTVCSNDIMKLIGLEKNVDIAPYCQHFVEFNEHNQAVMQLFNVAIGLEAQVVGDMQITNQVKNAYQWSADEDLAGPFLHRLLHTIFFTNKRVVQETPFRDGAASMSYAAVELLETLTASHPSPRILVLGLGEIGEDVCRNLVNTRAEKVTLSNRTWEKAAVLAEELAFDTISFDDFEAHLPEYDVIISAVVKPEPVITRNLMAKLKTLSFKYLIDLSVPRSIETEVEEIPGVLLYNVDDIQSKTTDALTKRLAAIPKVKTIISESFDDFANWSKEMEVSPVINKLKNTLEQIRKEEMTRYLKNVTQEESKIVDIVTKSMIQKIIKLPVLQLKAACKRGEAETLIDVLNDLFDLEKQSSDAKE